MGGRELTLRSCVYLGWDFVKSAPLLDSVWRLPHVLGVILPLVTCGKLLAASIGMVGVVVLVVLGIL